MVKSRAFFFFPLLFAALSVLLWAFPLSVQAEEEIFSETLALLKEKNASFDALRAQSGKLWMWCEEHVSKPERDAEDVPCLEIAGVAKSIRDEIVRNREKLVDDFIAANRAQLLEMRAYYDERGDIIAEERLSFVKHDVISRIDTSQLWWAVDSIVRDHRPFVLAEEIRQKKEACQKWSSFLFVKSHMVRLASEIENFHPLSEDKPAWMENAQKIILRMKTDQLFVFQEAWGKLKELRDRDAQFPDFSSSIEEVYNFAIREEGQSNDNPTGEWLPQRHVRNMSKAAGARNQDYDDALAMEREREMFFRLFIYKIVCPRLADKNQTTECSAWHALDNGLYSHNESSELGWKLITLAQNRFHEEVSNLAKEKDFLGLLGVSADQPLSHERADLSHLFFPPILQGEFPACFPIAVASDMDLALQRKGLRDQVSPWLTYRIMLADFDWENDFEEDWKHHEVTDEEILAVPDFTGIPEVYSLETLKTNPTGSYSQFDNVNQQTVGERKYQIASFAYLHPDFDLSYDFFRRLVDAGKPPVVVIPSDKRKIVEDWIYPRVGGRYRHALMIVGYGEGIDPQKLEKVRYFLVRDSLTPKPIHYKVAVSDLHPIGIYKVLEVEVTR